MPTERWAASARVGSDSGLGGDDDGGFELRVDLAVDAALGRIAAGTYGVCLRCGEAIGVDRLRARPTAELCIRCAVAVES